jgi:hypothetical protein
VVTTASVPTDSSMAFGLAGRALVGDGELDGSSAPVGSAEAFGVTDATVGDGRVGEVGGAEAVGAPVVGDEAESVGPAMSDWPTSVCCSVR